VIQGLTRGSNLVTWLLAIWFGTGAGAGSPASPASSVPAPSGWGHEAPSGGGVGGGSKREASGCAYRVPGISYIY
jgi:hypothetical protein